MSPAVPPASPPRAFAGALSALALCSACTPAAPAASPAAPSSPTAAAADPAARAGEAAMYALPLVIMDLTREEFFGNPVAADATPDRFLHVPILGNPTFRAVVRPNVDTLYSTAWLALGDEPVVLSVPPSNGRYFLVQCMDAWTNVFSAPGTRTLGDKGGRYAIVGPDWHGDAPADAELVRAPTKMVWVLGRVYVRDQADLPDARKFQRQIDLRPVSKIGDASYQGVYPHPPQPGARRPIMRERLLALGPQAFYERFAGLTAANPPTAQDAPFIRSVLVPLGLAPGMQMTWAGLTESQRRTLSAALDRVVHNLTDRTKLAAAREPSPTGWTSMAAELGQGSFGTNYQARAVVAAIGLGANLRADAIYMNDGVDAKREPLDGDKRYRLTFPAGQTPPVRGFWSITLYDDQGYLVANPVERYAVKSGDPLVAEPDGSLVVYLQPDDPGPDHRANWLPTPAHQRFELSLRGYWPGDDLLAGRWMPPAATAQ
jgi:hypothetical protein